MIRLLFTEVQLVEPENFDGNIRWFGLVFRHQNDTVFSSISFMIAEQIYGAHSAQVEMRLIANGESISITHMGPDFLLIESARDHPPGNATIILQVDQSERRWNVRLPNGISAGSKRVAIAASA